MTDSEIYNAVAKAMWSIMPKEAVFFEIFGKCYDDFLEHEAWLVGASGERFQFGFDDYPEKVLYEVMRNMRLLKEMDPFKAQPWTHFMVTLSEKGGFKVSFAYVPREENVIGIYMRGGTDKELADSDR
ncbi:hypothetical protein [Stenotrophomonas humi]